MSRGPSLETTREKKREEKQKIREVPEDPQMTSGK